MDHYFSDVMFARFSCVSVFSLAVLLSYSQFPKAGTRGEDNFLPRMGAIEMYTRCVNCCTRTGARIVISICVIEGYALYHVAPFCLPHDMYCSFSIPMHFV